MPRDADFDFKKIPLWQFVVMTIGAAIAGDVDVKLMYAMIGQRNSGKGMLMSAVEAAFENLVDTGKSANNLLGNDNKNDEAKKFMWLAQAAINGVRLLWTYEVRILCSRGETYIDGNLIKSIASGVTPRHAKEQRGSLSRPPRVHDVPILQRLPSSPTLNRWDILAYPLPQPVCGIA